MRFSIPSHARSNAPCRLDPAFFCSAFIGCWSLIFFLSGCAVGPNYKRPPVHAPENFRGSLANTSTNSLADLPWWEVFPDDTLQALIRTALTNSYDIRIAMARVEQARALAAQNRGLFFPQLDYQGSAGRGKNAAGGTAVPTGDLTTASFVAAGTMSWEIDLWGRIRRLNESARGQFLASQEARRAIMISVISEVAQAYFQLLALDRQLEIANRTTNSFGESWRIFSERLQGGIVSKLETSAAEAALASAAATVPDLERQIVLQENQISVLLGFNPGPLARSHALLEEALLTGVPAGLPSTLLERRPDIRQAEQTLRSFNAQVGVAANLTGPLFHGGSLRAQYRQALAVREQSRLQYQATVLLALQEVSNALVARQKFAQSRGQQARAVQAYQVAVEVSMQRYVAGRAGYYEVLQEQQLLFPSENSLVQTELNQLLSLVQLYRALGGGWEIVPALAEPENRRKAPRSE